MSMGGAPMPRCNPTLPLPIFGFRSTTDMDSQAYTTANALQVKSGHRRKGSIHHDPSPIPACSRAGYPACLVSPPQEEGGGQSKSHEAARFRDGNLCQADVRGRGSILLPAVLGG